MPLETAVIGAGVVSDRHLSALRQCPRTDLIAVCDTDESRARDAADRYDITPYFDIDELVEKVSPEWAHVCTPVQTHLDLTLRAIDAGIPVQIEKPVTLDSEEFEELESASIREGVSISVVQNHLFLPMMRRLNELIRAGELGEIRSVAMLHTGGTSPDRPNRGEWAFELPGGEFDEGLPHPIYVTLQAGGYPGSESDIHALTNLAENYEHDFTFDDAQVQYRSADGTLCSMTMTSSGIPQRRLVVDGSKSAATVDFISATITRHDHPYERSAVSRARNSLDRITGMASGTAQNIITFGRTRLSDDWETHRNVNGHHYQIDAEAKALMEDTEMPISLDHAKWTTAIIDRIREDAREREGNATDIPTTQSQ